MANSLMEDIRSDLAKIFSEKEEVVSEAGQKPVLEVNPGMFVEWVYNDREERQELGNNVIGSLAVDGKFSMTLDEVFEGIGFLYISHIRNWNHIRQQLDPATVKQFEAAGEIEEPSAMFDVKWSR